MKRPLHLFLFAFLLLGSIPLTAQLNILVVDDSDDTFMNTANIETGISDAGYTYTLYDAVDQGQSPDMATMEAYDLVIWHTSTDEGSLFFWAGNQSVNLELTNYLDGGGNLWVIGNDYLTDRHGSAPDAFSSGDFEYDYLGIDEFSVQSYEDDGDLGVPYMTPATGQPIAGLADIDFIFSTLWYADGVSPRAEAVPIYMMGDMNYIFYETPSGVWYDNGTSISLSYYFDLALGSSPTVISSNIGSVLAFFETAITTSIENPFAASLQMKMGPNPASEFVNIQFNIDESTELDIHISNLFGNQIAVLASDQTFSEGQQNINWKIPQNLASGMYFVTISNDRGSYTHQLEIIR